MKFVFEGTAKEFNFATMEEVLLRQVQDRSKDKRTVFIGGGVVLAIAVYDVASGDYKRAGIMLLIAVLLVVSQLRSAKSTGTVRDTIKRIKDAIAAQTEEESRRVFRYTFEGNSCTMSSGDEILGTWNCTQLFRVSEADSIIALWRRDGAIHKSVLPVPKQCLQDATMDDFRAYLQQHLVKKEKVMYYEIPEQLKTLLD